MSKVLGFILTIGLVGSQAHASLANKCNYSLEYYRPVQKTPAYGKVGYIGETPAEKGCLTKFETDLDKLRNSCPLDVVMVMANYSYGLEVDLSQDYNCLKHIKTEPKKQKNTKSAKRGPSHYYEEKAESFAEDNTPAPWMVD